MFPRGACLVALSLHWPLMVYHRLCHSVWKAFSYVGDFAIFTRSSSLPAAERRIQLAINRATKWTVTKKDGFTFSLNKNERIHYTKKRGLFSPLTLKLEQESIKVVREAKFLGLVFDAKLSWIPHLKMLRSRCLQSMNLLKCLSCTSWGADRASLLRL